jgi:hypothetical protein
MVGKKLAVTLELCSGRDSSRSFQLDVPCNVAASPENREACVARSSWKLGYASKNSTFPRPGSSRYGPTTMRRSASGTPMLASRNVFSTENAVVLAPSAMPSVTIATATDAFLRMRKRRPIASDSPWEREDEEVRT